MEPFRAPLTRSRLTILPTVSFDPAGGDNLPSRGTILCRGGCKCFAASASGSPCCASYPGELIMRSHWLAAIAILCLGSASYAADWGLDEGKPDIKSASSLAFGPDG